MISLLTSIFYSKLFGQAPSKQQADYAKWMLDDPRINFAISSAVIPSAWNHFGMQVESAEELTQLKALADAASQGQSIDQSNATCCYAKVKSIGLSIRKAWRGNTISPWRCHGIR